MSQQAIVLVDHGSRRPEANAVLEELVADLQREEGLWVWAAHMDLAPPTIAEAFDAAVTRGADSIRVVPFFLAPGIHSTKDIPELCAAAAVRHPRLRWHCTPPIGQDKRLYALVRDRLKKELSADQDADPRTATD